MTTIPEIPHTEISAQYPLFSLYKAIEANPNDESIWKKLTDLGDRELTTDNNTYGRLRIDEIKDVANIVNTKLNSKDLADILSQRASNGELWYDLILGNANTWLQKEMFCTLSRRLTHTDFHTGVDIGCGPGASLVPLSYLCRNPIGIDLSFSYLRIANERQDYHNEPKLIQGDVANMDFITDDSVDIVTSFGVDSYLSDPEFVDHIFSLERILKPEGKYYSIMGWRKPEGLQPHDILFLQNAKAVMVSGINEMIAQNYRFNRAFMDEFEVMKKCGFKVRLQRNKAQTWALIELTKGNS